MAFNIKISKLECSLNLLKGFQKTFYNSYKFSYLKDLQNLKNEFRYDLKYINTSSIYFKRRKTSEERKHEKIIEYAPKMKGEIVDVWRNITASELATILKKDIDYIREIFLNQIKSPDTIIDDIKLLQQALRRGGRRMRIIAKPIDKIKEISKKDIYPRPPPLKIDLKSRPSVVTVMGHVDHGKTTLLDALRHSNTVEKEFGGITQHIGAFLLILNSGAQITFLDTPGHAAFSAMRARGANLTDIVVLVVAADDGVKEQTIESVRMARQANVPILVAINKIDSPKADIQRTERMLMEIGIQVENLGGEVQCIPISALKKKNLNELVEAIILQSEILEIGGDPNGFVEGIIIESRIHPFRGKLCTVIIQRGTLKKGDILLAGTSMARVRNLRDANNKIMDKAPPGYPTEIEGWKELPSAGEQVLQVENEKKAREVIKIRQDLINKNKEKDELIIITEKEKQHQSEYKEKLMLKRRMGYFKVKNTGPRKPEIVEINDGIPILNLIIKTDVDGTLEALLNTLNTYNELNCKIDLIHYGVGAITENDIELASAFNAIIYAFNIENINNQEEFHIKIKHFNVIYKLIDDIKEEINNLLPLLETEEILGEAKVLQQFEINEGRKKVPIAGCRCVKGTLKKMALFKLIRDNNILFTGHLSAMRHLKNDVDTIKTDMECGLQLEDKSIICQPEDIIICFKKKMIEQKTNWETGF